MSGVTLECDESKSKFSNFLEISMEQIKIINTCIVFVQVEKNRKLSLE